MDQTIAAITSKDLTVYEDAMCVDADTLLRLIETTPPPNAQTEATDDVPSSFFLALTGHCEHTGEQSVYSRFQRLWVQTVWEAFKKTGLSIEDGIAPIENVRDKLRLQSLKNAAFEATDDATMRQWEAWCDANNASVRAAKEFDLKLAAATAAHNATADKYNAMRVPSLEALSEELRLIPWLAAVAYRAAQHRVLGYGGADMIPASFRGEDDCCVLHHLPYNELVRVVPYVRRLGYAVTLYSDEVRPFSVEGCPFSVKFVGRAPCMFKWKQASHFDGHFYEIRLHGTAPDQIRRRGLVKCVPRLLGWLRQARIALADPRRPGAMETLIQENEAGMAATDPPHWTAPAAEHAAEQRKRKRALVEALHASEEEVAEGARWADIQVRNKVEIDRRSGKPFVCPMRIEAVAGEHYVFQHPCDFQPFKRCAHEVAVLHHDEFTVEPWPETGFFKRNYEHDFEFRFSNDAEVESDADDDDDEEAE